MRFIHGLGYVGCGGIPLVSIFQVIATADGVGHLTGWSFTSWLIAITVGWLPVIGTVTGSYGAISRAARVRKSRFSRPSCISPTRRLGN